MNEDVENKTGTDDTQTAANNANVDQKDVSTEGTGADAQKEEQIDLDELLKEFDQKREAVQTQPKEREPETSEQKIDVNVLATLEARLNQQEAQNQRRELEGWFGKLTDGVQADMVDAEAYLNAQALRDPRLNRAYANRESNPKAWDKVWSSLKQDFAKRYGKKVDKQVTESRDAVASAVRSASTAAPDRGLTDKEVVSMSKADFDEAQRKLGVMPT